MTRLEAIDALLVKVKAGETPTDDDVWNAFSTQGRIGLHGLHVLPAFHGSLDAAIALCGVVLPGSNWMIGDKKPRAIIQCDYGQFFEVADTPASALMIAILEAMKAKEIANA